MIKSNLGPTSRNNESKLEIIITSVHTGTQNLNALPGTKMVYLPGDDFARYEPIVDSSEPGVPVFVEFDFPCPVVPLFLLESRAPPPASRRVLVVNIRQKPNSVKPQLPFLLTPINPIYVIATSVSMCTWNRLWMFDFCVVCSFSSRPPSQRQPRSRNHRPRQLPFSTDWGSGRESILDPCLTFA